MIKLALLLSMTVGSIYGMDSMVGITNIGDTCFISSVLQCMRSFTDINPQLRKGMFEENSLSCEYIDFLTSVKGAKEPVKPEMLLVKGRSLMDSTGQQDAGEFLLQLLDHLTDKDCKVKGDYFPGTTKPMNPISMMFHVGLERQLTGAMPEIEPYSSLDLPIKEGDGRLACVIDRFFQPEEVSHEGKTVTKQYKIDSIDEYLIINLKRTYWDGGPKKHTMRISFDLNGLKVKESFSLMAVIMHKGNGAEAGHYTAYVKRCDGWYYYDDAEVRQVSNEEMANIAVGGGDLTGTFIPATFIYKKD